MRTRKRESMFWTAFKATLGVCLAFMLVFYALPLMCAGGFFLWSELEAQENTRQVEGY